MDKRLALFAIKEADPQRYTSLSKTLKAAITRG